MRLRRSRGAVAAVGRLAARELGVFAAHDAGHRFRRDAEPLDQRPVHELGTAAGDGPHGQLLVPGDAELAHDEDVQGRTQALGNLGGDGNPASGQAEDE